MSEIESVLQWVAISKQDNGTPIIVHQFDEEGNQTNIKYLLDLAKEDLLDTMIAIPTNQRIGTEKAVGNPFIAVDMKTGLMNINGTNWEFLPNGFSKDDDIKFKPIWYHTVEKQFNENMILKNEKIVLYKIGWQFTHEGKNYQRIIFYDTQTGIFSLKEKR